MPLDPEIALQYNPTPNIGPNWNQIYQSQNQAYRNYLQQQDIAGTNALRDAFAGGNALDPNTGLPRPEVMSRVYQADPNKGLAMTETLAKLQDEHARAMYNNLQYAEKVGGSYREDVMEPSIKMYQDLQSRGLPQEQIQNLTEENKRKLFTEWKNSNGIPDATADRLDHPFFDLNNGQGTSWPFRSTAFEARTKAVTEGWKGKQFVDSRHHPFVFNPYYGTGAFDAVTHEPYTPHGAYHEVGTKGEEPEKPLPAPQPAQVQDDQGNWRPASVYRFPGRIEDASQPGSTLDPDKVRVEPKPTGPQTIKTAEPVRVPKPDGSGTEVKFATPPSRPGEPWKDQEGNPLPAPTSKVAPTDPDWPGAPDIKKNPAFTYVSERERLGLHMSTTWGMSKPDIQIAMAENDIRSSLGLPEEHEITREDARAAATNDVAIQHGMKAESGALTTVARQNALVQGFERTAERNANLIEGLGPEGAAGGVQAWNKWANLVRRNLQITPELAAYDTAVTDFKNEFVRIMTTASASGGAMTSDQARSEADRLFNVNQPFETLQGALKSARQQMGNRIDSIHDDYNAIMESIRKQGTFAQPPPLPSGEGKMGTGTGGVTSGTAPVSTSATLPANVPALIEQLSKDRKFAAPGSKADIRRDPGGKGPVIGQIVRQPDGTITWVPK